MHLFNVHETQVCATTFHETAGVMSLVCPLCDVTVSKHSQLMTHIRLLHADDPNFMIQCNRQGCKRTFWKFTVTETTFMLFMAQH